jgi:phenylalanyl-tRNA synthetase beta chain
MIGKKDLAMTKVPAQDLVYVQNPLSEDQEALRPSALPGMLKVAAHNFKNAQKDLRFFEIGKIYLPSGEVNVVSIALTGKRPHDWRSPQAASYDFYDIKGAVEKIFKMLKLEAPVFVPSHDPSLEENESAQIIFKGQEIGFVGKIRKDVLGQWNIKHQDVFFAQIAIDRVREHQGRVVRHASLGEYPGVVRDVSLALKGDVSYQALKEAVLKLNEPLLTAIHFIEQYLGDKIPSGHRGMTISLVYRSPKRTLTEKEVEEAHQKICDSIVKTFQAVKR